MPELMVGDKAPAFTLPRDGGEIVSLEALKGKPVVLFFYPKDDTSGCTAEAVAFTALKPEFDKLGVALVGMSPNNVKSHDKFIAKHDLDIPLVADEEMSALEAYGVWVEKSMYGRKYMGVVRTTYLIDEAGKVARRWDKVKVPGHAEEVLEAVKELRRGVPASAR